MRQKYLTQKGFQKLKDELDDRKLKRRRAIAQAIKEAKEQGDLSENAEYIEAKRQQRENEGRIMTLENMLRTSEIVKDDDSINVVKIGCIVDVETNGVKNVFTIVGASEADPANGLISNESPLGGSLLGKKIGDLVEVTLPNGNSVVHKIVKISR